MSWKTLTLALIAVALITTGALAALHGSTLAQDSKGIILYKEGKFREASRVLKIQVESEPKNELSLTYLGLARVHSGDAPGAVEPLKKAIELNEKNAKAHYGMGLASAKLGKLDDAIVELEKTCALAPDDAYAHYHLGMAYNQKGKKDLAIPHLRRFVELDPDAPEAPAVRSFLSNM